MSLTDVSRPWTASSMELAPSAAIAASVGLRRLMDQWAVWPASRTPLTRFIGLAPLRRMHARPTNRTPPLLSAKARGSWKSGVALLNQIKGMGWFGQGQNSQVTLCPRDATSKNFGRGHIGRGWTNIAPLFFFQAGNCAIRPMPPWIYLAPNPNVCSGSCRCYLLNPPQPVVVQPPPPR